MELGITGIKCDAEGCDYKDEFGSWGTTPEEVLAVKDQYLNKPCPKCGANLLTEEDANTIITLVNLVAPITALEDAMVKELGEAHPLNKKIKTNIIMDGSGEVDFEFE